MRMPDNFSPAQEKPVLAMNSERILYRGRLGATSMRALGSVTIYVAMAEPFLLKREDGQWQECRSAILLPQAPHQIRALESVFSVLIEPECVDLSVLPRREIEFADSREEYLGEELRTLGLRVASGEGCNDLLCQGLDAVLFNGALRRKKLDARIADVLDAVRANSDGLLSAEQSAEIAGLSFSRFLHLFKEEVGLTFRGFKAWKRARQLLYFVTQSPSLTDVALEIGYPDSSHFSHSIRNVYGWRPKDMFAGSRRMELFAC